MADSHSSVFVSNAWRERLGWDTMTSQQQETLVAYGLAMFREGSDAARSLVRCDDIDKDKYAGRVVMLDDGKRWEVDLFGVGNDWLDADVAPCKYRFFRKVSRRKELAQSLIANRGGITVLDTVTGPDNRAGVRSNIV